MVRVGIRELKQNASAVVARTKAGEVITITDRGVPVATLQPIKKSRLDEMIEAGLATPATRSVADLPAPIKLPPTAPGSAELLDDLRGERV